MYGQTAFKSSCKEIPFISGLPLEETLSIPCLQCSTSVLISRCFMKVWCLRLYPLPKQMWEWTVASTELWSIASVTCLYLEYKAILWPLILSYFLFPTDSYWSAGSHDIVVTLRAWSWKLILNIGRLEDGPGDRGRDCCCHFPAGLNDNSVEKNGIIITLIWNLTQALNSKCEEFFRTLRMLQFPLLIYLLIMTVELQHMVS